MMKVGIVAILGRPNVGKSTFLNAVLSKKISIVSPKAQTTRDAIMGIYTTKKEQILFVDTPGIYFGDQKLDSHMRRAAFGASHDVDALLYLIDASEESLDADIRILNSISSNAPKIIILNKIDLVSMEVAKAKVALLQQTFKDAKVLETAFMENFGIKEVKNEIEPYLVDGEPFFPFDTITDKPLDYQCKEIIREKLLHFLRQEIPHQSAVRIDSLDNKKSVLYIHATIIVDRDSHKGIVIGKGGEMIKKISMAARQEMERMFHQKVGNLLIKVEVIPDWRNDLKVLSQLGYGDK